MSRTFKYKYKIRVTAELVNVGYLIIKDRTSREYVIEEQDNIAAMEQARKIFIKELLPIGSYKSITALKIEILK